VDDELLLFMSIAGCSLIHFGIESGNENLRKRVISKGDFSNEKIKEVFKKCKKFKIKLGLIL